MLTSMNIIGAKQREQLNSWDKMLVIYSEKNDKLILINTEGTPKHQTKEYNSFVSIDFNEDRVPTMMEVSDASILFKIPKKVLRELVERRD